MKSKIHEHDSFQDCVYCKNNKNIEIPQEIIDACIQGNLVIFAGAGISTESRLVYPFSLYEDIESELGIKELRSLPFPELMSKYCTEKKSKSYLLQKIRDRIEYIKSFPELSRVTTRFHNELSTIYPIQEIITTNWDDFFEKKCSAIPIVTPEDFAFWNTPERKVFKIHGSINNLGSIVATSEDYKKCYKQLKSGIIGSSLKLMLATKVIVFVGYSFRDYDFNKIYSLLSKEMKDILPHSYVVNPSESISDKIKPLNTTVIRTDATHFLKLLKKILIKKNVLIDDERFDSIYEVLLQIKMHHHKFLSLIDMKKRPEAILNSCYQEGLIHAFERMLAKVNTGQYSHNHNIIHWINDYEKIKKEKTKYRKYGDVAYVEGYINGLSYLLASDKNRKYLPYYYVFGSKENIRSFSRYVRLSKRASVLHKSSYKWAKKNAERLGEGMTYHHTPFLI